jgi:probable phosphoglycerate mutase
MEKHKGKTVLIVTHAANVRVINYYFKGKPKNYDFGKRVVEKGELITLGNENDASFNTDRKT